MYPELNVPFYSDLSNISKRRVPLKYAMKNFFNKNEEIRIKKNIKNYENLLNILKDNYNEDLRVELFNEEYYVSADSTKGLENSIKDNKEYKRRQELKYLESNKESALKKHDEDIKKLDEEINGLKKK